MSVRACVHAHAIRTVVWREFRHQYRISRDPACFYLSTIKECQHSPSSLCLDIYDESRNSDIKFDSITKKTRDRHFVSWFNIIINKYIREYFTSQRLHVLSLTLAFVTFSISLMIVFAGASLTLCNDSSDSHCFDHVQ